MNDVMERATADRGAFGSWLAAQSGEGLIGQLAKGAREDRRFPKGGSPDDVRRHLSAMQADGDMFAAVDEAEIDWLAL